MLWLLASAVAAELLVWVPGGAVEAGARSQIGVWCVGCAAPLPPGAVSVEGAAVTAVRVLDDGSLRLDLAPSGHAPSGKASLRVRAETPEGSLSAIVPVQAPPGPALELNIPTEIALSEGRVELHMRSARPVSPDDVVIRVSEGTVGPVRSVVGGLTATLTLAPERVARPLLVAASVRSEPGLPPAFAAVRLRSRITGNVAAETGSRITIRVGGRTYGPFTAGAEGSAAVVFDAQPGEASYELTVADDLGNTQKLSQAVPAFSRPVLLGIEVATGRGGQLWLAATDARGAAWSDAAPLCRTGVDPAEAAAALDRGRWRWSPTSTSRAAETAVGCTLREAAITTRLAGPAPLPELLSVRVYPEVLSADFPLAEVQAVLLDGRGERLPPEGIVVSAAHGALTPVQAEGVWRGNYDGTGAAALGADELRASWALPTGSGAPARVELCVAKGQAGTVAVGRVLDAAGRPLVGVELGAMAGEALLKPMQADARGYARWLLPAVPAQRVRVQAGSVAAGSVAAEVLALDARPGDAGCITRAAPERADLDVVVRVPIRSGRVRQVFLDTEPRTLTLGPGATARIRVRMLDAAGAAVKDEPLSVTASEGTVGPALPDSDGSLVAEFTPAPAAGAREVRISATTSAGTVATTLSVAPRPVRGFAWAGLGWIDNFGAISSPWGSLGIEHRLPLAGLSVRSGVGLYGLDTVVLSDEGNVRAQGTFFPVEMGATFTDRGPRFSIGAGLGLVLVPYTLTATFPDGESAGGLAFAPPGVDAHGTFGWRVGQTEVFAELGYLLTIAPEGVVTIAENAGGLRVIGGYRLLY